MMYLLFRSNKVCLSKKKITYFFGGLQIQTKNRKSKEIEKWLSLPLVYRNQEDRRKMTLLLLHS
jgi:hypothetical protein